jgi:hypothetical protein
MRALPLWRCELFVCLLENTNAARSKMSKLLTLDERWKLDLKQTWQNPFAFQNMLMNERAMLVLIRS